MRIRDYMFRFRRQSFSDEAKPATSEQDPIEAVEEDLPDEDLELLEEEEAAKLAKWLADLELARPRWLLTAAEAETMQRKEDRARNQPVALAELSRDDGAASKLFDGLYLHYVECLMSGRLDVWARAAHGCIDLLASPSMQVHERKALPDYVPPREPEQTHRTLQ